MATVSPKGPPPAQPPGDPIHGADAQWERDIFPILKACVARHGGDRDGLGGVARDLIDLIQERLRPPTLDRSRRPSPGLENLLVEWREALSDALALLESRCQPHVRPTVANVASDYLGAST